MTFMFIYIYTHIHMGFHHPYWGAHLLQRGGSTTNHMVFGLMDVYSKWMDIDNISWNGIIFTCYVCYLSGCVAKPIIINVGGVFPPINPSYVDVHQGYVWFWPKAIYYIQFSCYPQGSHYMQGIANSTRLKDVEICSSSTARGISGRERRFPAIPWDFRFLFGIMAVKFEVRS